MTRDWPYPPGVRIQLIDWAFRLQHEINTDEAFEQYVRFLAKNIPQRIRGDTVSAIIVHVTTMRNWSEGNLALAVNNAHSLRETTGNAIFKQARTLMLEGATKAEIEQAAIEANAGVLPLLDVWPLLREAKLNAQAADRRGRR